MDNFILKSLTTHKGTGESKHRRKIMQATVVVRSGVSEAGGGGGGKTGVFN